MKYKPHPASELFPLLSGDDFTRLCADIREHGLKLPIIIHPDGTVLDGRNRLRACEEMGIRPVTVPWSGKPGDEIPFVLSLNLSRRHLDTSQRAMVAAKIATMRQGNPNTARAVLPPTQPEAAKTLHVSPDSVQRARVVLEEGTPEQIKAVESGEKTVAEVVREIRPKAVKEQPEPSQIAAPCSRCREFQRTIQNLEKQLETYVQIIEGDDSIRDSKKEIDRLTSLNRILEERNNGFMAEKAEAIKSANMWKNRFLALEKKGKS